jgi:hypothetical protein
MAVDVRQQVELIKRQMTAIGARQVPFAASRALNQVAVEVKDQTIARMRQVFKAPVRYTLSSMYVRRSSKANLVAEVGIKDKQARYLRTQEYGGGRRHTRFEARLYFAGVLMDGEYVVPTASKERFGKITRGTYTQVLSQLQGLREGSATDSARSKRARKRSGSIFIPGSAGAGAREGGLPRHIWRRNGITIEPLFWIAKRQPAYAAKLGFREWGAKKVRGRFPVLLRRELEAAIASSR